MQVHFFRSMSMRLECCDDGVMLFADGVVAVNGCVHCPDALSVPPAHELRRLPLHVRVRSLRSPSYVYKIIETKILISNFETTRS